MTRKKTTYILNPNVRFMEKLIHWSKNQTHFLLLNSNSFDNDKIIKKKYDWIAAIGMKSEIESNQNEFHELKKYYNNINDWIFGYIGYDAKNDIENLSSNNPDGLNFPSVHFYQPEMVLTAINEELSFFYTDSTTLNSIDQFIRQIESQHLIESKQNHINFEPSVKKDEYLKKVECLMEEIRFGNIYEINFCMEYFSRASNFNPCTSYIDLNKISSSPFSCFGKFNDKYVLSTSPERFLKKVKNRLYSQPIKGTSPRKSTIEEDEKEKTQLLSSQKERSENVMIVDLVRNDLSKTAKKGSVKVEELFGIYSFPTVHQMISTISSEVEEKHHVIDVIKSVFPMGSMTGAPKIKAMDLIEKYETKKRGLYSGALGYIDPEGDFDFNVIIRTLLYNSQNQYLSFTVGSAITSQSEPLKEFEECLVKARALFELFHPRVIN